MKHEFKATYRTFLPIYIGLVLITGIGCIASVVLRSYQNSLLNIALGFGILVFVLSYIFVIISPFIFLPIRFYRTTATREAYLTFSVPADTKIILLAKFIVAFVWTILTVFLWITAFAIFMDFVSDGNAGFFRFLFEGSVTDIAVSLLSMTLGIALQIMSIFTAVSLSQLVRDHRILASFGFYAAIYTVQQILSVIVLIPFMFSNLGNITSSVTSPVDEFTMGISPNLATSYTATWMYLIPCILSLVLTIAYYFLANHMLKKKLNLL